MSDIESQSRAARIMALTQLYTRNFCAKNETASEALRKLSQQIPFDAWFVGAQQ
jgi:hypothetical protein